MKGYKLIIDFLRIIGADHEAERYIKLFHRGNPVRFAVIKVGGAAIESSKDIIGVDLAYLCQLNLYPIVIHGGGPQINKALFEAGLDYKKIDGKRVTTKSQIPIIKRTLDHINAQLVNSINSYGGKAVGLTRDIFIAERSSDKRYGHVGEVKKVNTEPIYKVIRNKGIPVISCLGVSEYGEYYNINADESAKFLVLTLKPKKYIIITEEGGINDTQGKIISRINLIEELPEMEKNGILRNGMLLKVKETKSLIEQINYHLPIQITSDNALLKELFTDEGCGTYIKLGTEILEFSNWKKINKHKVKNLIEKSFGRSLKRDYFKKPVKHIFLDYRYRAMSVIRKVEGMYYLDKFCVAKTAQGEGVGGDIWFRTLKKYPNLFWRARLANPINNWYFEKSHGTRKYDKWILFWINLGEKQIKKAAKYILNLEESFFSNNNF